MSIIFNSEENSFTLHEPSEEEKQALFDLAVEQITYSFGKTVAHNILEDAAAYNQIKNGDKTIN